jgi:predicted nucleic acid-binding protein
MKLLNVRLSPEDVRRAAALRTHGVLVSHIVREAIRSAYERRAGGRGGRRRASAIMAEIYREHPEFARPAPGGQGCPGPWRRASGDPHASDQSSPVILLDTTPLVALCDPRDGLNRRALRDLDRLAREPLVLCEPALTETCFLMPRRPQRERLRRVLTEFPVAVYQSADEHRLSMDVFEWLLDYQDHDPDWADGYVAVVAGIERRARVWTYDREFRTTWRRPDGTRIPLAAP